MACLLCLSNVFAIAETNIKPTNESSENVQGVQCQDVFLLLDEYGSVDLFPEQVYAGSDFTVSSMEVSEYFFYCFHVGTPQTTVLTAYDENNIPYTCTANVFVDDIEAPTVVCQDITVALDATGNVSIGSNDVVASWSDNCQNINHTLSSYNFNCTDVGTNTVTVTSSDFSGNQGTCTAVVYVEDNMAPIAYCQDLTVTLDASGTATINPSDIDNGFSTDNCGAPLLTLSQSTFTQNNVGANTVVLTAEDNAGNTSTCAATVTVVAPANYEVICQDQWLILDAWGTAQIYDQDVYVSSNFTVASLMMDRHDFFCYHHGTNTPVTLTATGTNGEVASCTANVAVDDLEAPVVVCQNITVQLDVTGTVSITASDVVVSFTDNCQPQNLFLSQSTFDCTNIGSNSLVVNGTDVHGLNGTCTSIVTVEESIMPTVQCQDYTLTLDASGTAVLTAADINAGAADNCGIASLSISQNNFTSNDIGTQAVVLTATDFNGNNASCVSLVSIEQGVTNEITCQDVYLLLDDFGYAGIYPEQVLTGSNFPVVNMTLSEFDFFCYQVGQPNPTTLTAYDQNGATVTCTVDVIVDDITTPTQVCQDLTIGLDATGTVTIDESDVVTQASDNCEPVYSYLNNNTFDCTNIGDNTVTVTTNDVNGNTSTCTVIVTIMDNIAPTAICQDVTVELDPSGTITVAAMDVNNGSTDNCGNPAITISQSVFTMNDLGANTISMVAVDAAGNTATCNAVVTVTAGTTNSVECQDVSLILNEFGTANLLPTDVFVSSNFNVATMTLSESDFFCYHHGQATQTVLTAYDQNGNAETCFANVFVDDVDPPIVACQNVTLALDATGSVNITPEDLVTSPADNCGSATLTLSQSTFDCSHIGNDINTNVVTVVAQDVNGNTSTCGSLITIEDNIAPNAVCQDLTVTLDATGTVTIDPMDLDNGSTDNCSIYSITTDQTTFTTADLGSNVVTVLALDAQNGYGDICTSTITVLPPSVNEVYCLDVDIKQDEFGFAFVDAQLLYDGSTFTPTSFVAYPDAFSCQSGPQAVTLTVTDQNANQYTCTSMVTIHDIHPPVIDCVNSLTYELNPNGTVNFNPDDFYNSFVEPCVTSITLDALQMDCNNVGTNVITLTIADEYLNTATCAVDVTIEDNTMPTAICQDVTVTLDATGFATVTAQDLAGQSTDECGIIFMLPAQHTFEALNIGQNPTVINVTDFNGLAMPSHPDADELNHELIAEKTINMEIMLYPNPVSNGATTIRVTNMDSGYKDVTTTLFDAYGITRNVIRQVETETEMKILMDGLDGLVPGIYLMTVNVEGKILREQLIIR